MLSSFLSHRKSTLHANVLNNQPTFALMGHIGTLYLILLYIRLLYSQFLLYTKEEPFTRLCKTDHMVGRMYFRGIAALFRPMQ